MVVAVAHPIPLLLRDLRSLAGPPKFNNHYWPLVDLQPVERPQERKKEMIERISNLFKRWIIQIIVGGTFTFGCLVAYEGSGSLVRAILYGAFSIVLLIIFMAPTVFWCHITYDEKLDGGTRPR